MHAGVAVRDLLNNLCQFFTERSEGLEPPTF
jgi:hypothetical protein